MLRIGGNIMDNNENKTKGAVQISDDVISLIATTATMEVDGVAQTAVNMVGNIIDKLKNTSKGVSVAVNEGKVSVDVNIIVYYEYNIQEVAKKVQNNIKSVLETMTCMETDVVNVNVVGIEAKKEKSEKRA